MRTTTAWRAIGGVAIAASAMTALACGSGAAGGDELQADAEDVRRPCPSDGDPCTVEVRRGRLCVSEPAADGTACSGGSCLAGNCVATPSGCGACAPPQTCGGGGIPNVCGCTPTTCAAQGVICGSIDDRCGGTLACGPACADGYTIGFASSAPAIDGNLAEYSAAPAVTFGSGVSVRALWDATALYVAFDVSDTQLNASVTARDGAVWEEDAVELFIDTLQNGGAAVQDDDFQVLVNALGTQADASTSLAWNAVWDSAVVRTGTNNANADADTGFKVEIRLPWDQLGVAPHTGRSFAMSFALDDNDAAGRSCTMWGGYTDNFQNPSRWKTVTLVGGAVPSAAATPTISPPGGAISVPTTVSLACASPSPTIRYTLDGSTPTASSAVNGAPFVVSATTTVKALCQSAGLADSAVASATFTLAEPAADWPVPQSIPIGSAPILMPMSFPGYLQWTLDQRTTPPNFPAGMLPTEVTRVTDAAAFGLAGEDFFKMSYAKVPPWNADDTLMMVLRSVGGLGVVIDGRTFQWVRNLTSMGSGGRWSNVDPKLFYGQDGQLPRLKVVDVTTDALRVAKDFAGLGYSSSGGVSMFAGEGRQSNDDRYWPLQLGTPDGRWDIVIYDLLSDRIAGTIQLPQKGGYNYVDYWGMSQKGQFVVTQTQTAWTTRDGISVPVGLNVWSTSGQYLRTKYQGMLGHIDFGIDVAGNEVVVFIGNKYEANDKIGQTWRLDGADGQGTVDQFKNMIGWNYHISTANTRRPGWALVTSSGHAIPSNYSWAPMWNHTFAVRLDGSGKIAPIANLHHATTPMTVADYDRGSFGAPNRSFTAVLWGGTWGDADISRPIHSYVARPRR